MPRGKPRTAAAPHSSAFADAIKFVSLILKDHGAINETHISIQNNNVTAFNGVLAIGCKCDNDIMASPQAKLLLEALSKCGQQLAITQLATNRLSIKSDKFRALIPCVDTNLLQQPVPDTAVAIIDDRLKDALIAAGDLSNENGQQIYNVSVLLHQGCVISSMGGGLLYQHWHGIDLPPMLAIPKTLCSTLGKINKKLTQFGYSPWSITLYFEDGSWIRSQLYAEPWPEVAHIFECKADLQPIAIEFWKALASVSPFSEGMVWLRGGKLTSHAAEGAGAEYEIAMPGAWCYPARQLAMLKSWVTHADFQAQSINGPILLAMGRNARAVIAGVRE